MRVKPKKQKEEADRLRTQQKKEAADRIRAQQQNEAGVKNQAKKEAGPSTFWGRLANVLKIFAYGVGVLIIISLFFWYKLPQEKYSKYFAFFSIIFSIGQIFVLFMVLLLVGYFGKIQEFVIKEKN